MFQFFVNWSQANSFLPNTIEWKHCLGSEEKYRGYPCSLWSIFHVLTVNQIEIENEKKNPCNLNLFINLVYIDNGKFIFFFMSL